MKLRHLLALVCALALGVASLAIGRSSPGGSFGGESTTAALTLLATGWALVICGVAACVRRPASRFGALLVAAGFAWFLVEFENPAIGSPVVFTVGLLGSAACPALVAHAALAYPGGRVAGRAERVGVSIAYGSTILVLGLLAALGFDPAAQGCSQCPQNLLRLTNAPELVAELDRLGLVLGLVWAPALAALGLADRPFIFCCATARGARAAPRRRLPRTRRRHLRAQPPPRVPLQRQRR